MSLKFRLLSFLSRKHDVGVLFTWAETDLRHSVEHGSPAARLQFSPTDLYPNIATEPKCKHMLAKNHKSAHQKIGADRPSIFRVIVISVKVLQTYVRMELLGAISPASPTGGGDNN